MDSNLKEIHFALDELVDREYGTGHFENDSQRLKLLLSMYKEEVRTFEE